MLNSLLPHKEQWKGLEQPPRGGEETIQLSDLESKRERAPSRFVAQTPVRAFICKSVSQTEDQASCVTLWEARLL